MIQVAAERVPGIEIRLWPESKAVVGERAASIPKDGGIDDAANDLDDRLIAPICVRGEQPQAVAGGADVGRQNGGTEDGGTENGGTVERWNGGTGQSPFSRRYTIRRAIIRCI